jgi:hypothetical protein
MAPRRTGRFHITARWISEGIPEARLDYAMPSNEQCREQIIDLRRR